AADRIRRPGPRKWFCAGTSATAAGLFFCGTWMESPLGMAVLLSLSSVCLLSMQAFWWSFTAEVGGQHLGAIFGLMNGLGAFGAMASQFFFGMFHKWRVMQGYSGRDIAEPAFVVYSLVLLGAAMSWALLDVRPLRGEGKPREHLLPSP